MLNRSETWRDLQAAEVVAYRSAFARQGDYRGFFSIPEYGDADRAGVEIAETCSRCLDIGCGVLPRPVYMQTDFVGIDPFFGEGPRQFPFAQALGEHLPFPSQSFPCCSFMSTLDHQIEPLVALGEAWRILKSYGYLWLWLELRSDTDARYHWWRTQPPGTLFDAHHQHAFIKADVVALLAQSGFRWLGMNSYPGTSYWPPTQLIVGMKQ